MDETIDTPEPETQAKPAAASRAGSKSLKRDAKKARAKAPKPSKKARGQVRR